MFSRKKPRALSADDVTLWREVVKSATPLHPDTLVIREKVALPVAPVAARISLPPGSLSPEKARGRGTVSFDLAPTRQERLSPDPLLMDHKRFGQMRRGKLPPDARLDLHGLTLDQAHGELVPFLLASWAAGLRLVLVITGKGRMQSGQHAGVLRHQVPRWISMPPLRQIVLQISEAHQSHGGSGAIYVYLRRTDRGPFGK